MKLFTPGAVGAFILLGAAVGLALHGQPTPSEKWQYLAPKYEAKLVERKVYIDPAELLHLMNDDYIELVIFDVRSESDWNQFRLMDSERVPLEALREQRDRMKQLPNNAVLVFVSNDEGPATEAWKQAMALARPNAYILAGGLNHWLDVYGVPQDEVGGHGQAAGSDVPDETLRHPFRLALGDRHGASRPDEHHVPHREFEPKVELKVKVKKAGGCG
jgi:rhodanese-related sulfurtransferase